MTAFVSGPVHVRVPATSANLGPGFDSLGLALALHDEVTAEVVADDLRVDVEGEGAEEVPRDASHLIVRAMHRTFEALGVVAPGLRLHCTNRIPHGRGLGSSAAAIVAGILLARAVTVGGAERFDDAAALRLANEMEGHPDNVAPCLLGGLTIAWTQDGVAHALRRDVDEALVPVLIVAPLAVSTELARGLLPGEIPHADAAFAAGRAALLVAALTGEGSARRDDPSALLAGTEDRLHQSYRAAAMPETVHLMLTLRAAGHAAVISGAGPSVLVLSKDEAQAGSILDAVPEGWVVLQPRVDRAGAQVRR